MSNTVDGNCVLKFACFDLEAKGPDVAREAQTQVPNTYCIVIDNASDVWTKVLFWTRTGLFAEIFLVGKSNGNFKIVGDLPEKNANFSLCNMYQPIPFENVPFW